MTRIASEPQARHEPPARERPARGRVSAWANPALPLAILAVTGLILTFTVDYARGIYPEFTIGIRQAINLVLAAPVVFVCSRLDIRTLRALAYPLFVFTLGLLILVLVPGLGHPINGATTSIVLPGGFALVPATLATLALALWGADLLTRKMPLLTQWSHVFLPLVPVASLFGVLLLLQPDPLKAILVASVLIALLLCTPLHRRYIAVFLVVLMIQVLVRTLSEFPGHSAVSAWISPGDDPVAAARVLAQREALQNVGLFHHEPDVAAGLPSASYASVAVTAVLAFGRIALVVLLLLVLWFVCSTVSLLRRAQGVFDQALTAATGALVAVPAIWHLAVPLGLAPDVGVPLPLVSFASSLTLASGIAAGLLASVFRRVRHSRQLSPWTWCTSSSSTSVS